MMRKRNLVAVNILMPRSRQVSPVRSPTHSIESKVMMGTVHAGATLMMLWTTTADPAQLMIMMSMNTVRTVRALHVMMIMSGKVSHTCYLAPMFEPSGLTMVPVILQCVLAVFKIECHVWLV